MPPKTSKITFPKTDLFIKDCIDWFNADWPKIIGHGANFTFSKYGCVSFARILKSSDNLSTYLEYEFSGAFTGKFFKRFSCREAIIIGGLLLMEEPDDIQKHISLTRINEDYQDAFNEFANQASASYENVFNNHLGKNEKINVKFVTSHYPPVGPDRLTDIFAMEHDDEIFVTNSDCSIWTFNNGSIDLLFPIDVIERFFNETISLSQNAHAGQVVIISDYDNDVSFFKKCLRNLGYKVHVCSERDDAIFTLHQDRVDFVFLDYDYGKPATNGVELLRRIRMNMMLGYMPIVMCSSKPTREHIINSLKVGSSDFLVKPFTKECLLSKMQKIRETAKRKGR